MSEENQLLTEGKPINAFHLTEYSALRAELTAKSQQISDSMRLLVFGVPALIAWLLVQSNELDRVTSFIAAWLPLIATNFFSGYRKDLIIGIKRIAIYSKKVEERYGDDGLGWESRGSEDEIIKGRDYFQSSKRIILITQLLTLTFGIYYSIENSIEFSSVINFLNDGFDAVARLIPGFQP